MNEHVGGIDRPDHVPVVDCEVLEPRIGGLDEDVGLVPGAAQHALDAQHFVADGVAVAKRGEHLVDARTGAHERLPAGTAAPDGMPANTSLAGGMSRRRRANHPGSGSMAVAGGPSRFSRSNMSRYFFSITGHV